MQIHEYPSSLPQHFIMNLLYNCQKRKEPTLLIRSPPSSTQKCVKSVRLHKPLMNGPTPLRFSPQSLGAFLSCLTSRHASMQTPKIAFENIRSNSCGGGRPVELTWKPMTRVPLSLLGSSLQREVHLQSYVKQLWVQLQQGCDKRGIYHR